MAKDKIKEKSIGDLEKALAAERKKLRDLRFGMSGDNTKDTSTAKKTRKKIARILTQINNSK